MSLLSPTRRRVGGFNGVVYGYFSEIAFSCLQKINRQKIKLDFDARGHFSFQTRGGGVKPFPLVWNHFSSHSEFDSKSYPLDSLVWNDQSMVDSPALAPSLPWLTLARPSSLSFFRWLKNL